MQQNREIQSKWSSVNQASNYSVSECNRSSTVAHSRDFNHSPPSPDSQLLPSVCWLHFAPRENSSVALDLYWVTFYDTRIDSVSLWYEILTCLLTFRRSLLPPPGLPKRRCNNRSWRGYISFHLNECLHTEYKLKWNYVLSDQNIFKHFMGAGSSSETSVNFLQAYTTLRSRRYLTCENLKSHQDLNYLYWFIIVYSSVIKIR